MALLNKKWTMFPHEEELASKIFMRLEEIDDAFRDYFISWTTTKQLLQERTELIKMLQKLGYEL